MLQAPGAEAAEHFEDLAKQGHAARLGMWAFLGSEMLLFAGLFALYASYRAIFRADFHAAGMHMEVALGTANTFVLLTSSLTVALAIWGARTGRKRLITPLLLITLALAALFLVLKGIEYGHHFEEGIFPGQYYAFAELPAHGARMFFTLYFFMTGLHALHVIAGMGVLVWCLLHALRGHWSPAHHTGIELGGMYWHLVDLIWIFLWPLLYLVD
jgi:cytochrome c oxidase subunit 3